MGHDLSDGEGVGAFAAGVLEDLYAAVYGERPVGVRTWYDRDSLLMLLRLPGPAPFGGRRELAGTLPYEAIPELVAAAVRVQTGCELAVGSWSVEADLGLVMFVFRLPAKALAGSPAERPRVAAAADAPKAEPPRERGTRRKAARVPSWRAWSPVPPGAAGEHEAPAERRRLRLVDDEREPGSIPR